LTILFLTSLSSPYYLKTDFAELVTYFYLIPAKKKKEEELALRASHFTFTDIVTKNCILDITIQVIPLCLASFHFIFFFFLRSSASVAGVNMTGKGALFLALLVAVLALVSATSSGHVIGVDFGSEYIKVAGPHGDKGLDIVLNELSRRKTENFVGFRNGDIYIGDTAKSLAARFPLCTASAINQLVGIRKDSALHSVFQDLQYEYHVKFNKRGSATVDICSVKEPFTAEELFSLILSYCKAAAEHDDVVTPTGVVITIPFHTSPVERRAILDAARFSGLKVLGLMHSTTAAAFYYGVRHRGFGNNTVKLLVFDLGATHTEVGVYEISPPPQRPQLQNAFGTLKTLGVLEDRSLGGRAFDLCVARIMEKEAREKLNIGPVLGGKSSAQLKSQFSLLRAANKVRETLSVNSVTPYTVEGIVPDRDFHSSMTRATFESECTDIFDRVRNLALNVTKAINVSLAELTAFEMMGGISRTPKIIADLSALSGRDVDRTMNMDEAAAMGAGYYAAKLSPLYHTKSLRLDEAVPYNVEFEVHPQQNKKKPLTRRPLFVGDGALLGDPVSLTFNRTDDFAIDLFTDAEPKAPIATIEVTEVKRILTTLGALSPTVKHPNNSHMIRVQVVMNEAGLLQIEHTEAVVRYAAEVMQKTKENVTDPTTGEVKEVDKQGTVIRMRHKTAPVPTTLIWKNPAELSAQEWNASEKKLASIWEAEHVKHVRATAKNNLETYIFWIKYEGIGDNAEVAAAASPEAVQNVMDEVARIQDWLEEGDGNSDSCPAAEYDARHAELKKLVHALTSEPEAESPGEALNHEAAGRGSAPTVDEDGDEGDL
jgi:molecular chaperone DnaK (HSP70)